MPAIVTQGFSAEGLCVHSRMTDEIIRKARMEIIFNNDEQEDEQEKIYPSMAKVPNCGRHNNTIPFFLNASTNSETSLQ